MVFGKTLMSLLPRTGMIESSGSKIKKAAV